MYIYIIIWRQLSVFLFHFNLIVYLYLILYEKSICILSKKPIIITVCSEYSLIRAKL